MRRNKATSEPIRLSREEAKTQLPEDMRPIFDQLCDETLQWSKYYYGTNLISYSILFELVKDGWKKN
jgi:hypothetical protein